MSESHNVYGREYLKLSEAQPGMLVELDDEFTCASGVVKLEDCFTGIWFPCSEGRHYLDSHIYCTGIFKCS